VFCSTCSSCCDQGDCGSSPQVTETFSNCCWKWDKCSIRSSSSSPSSSSSLSSPPVWFIYLFIYLLVFIRTQTIKILYKKKEFFFLFSYFFEIFCIFTSTECFFFAT
jgi:hypothetical protein